MFKTYIDKAYIENGIYSLLCISFLEIHLISIEVDYMHRRKEKKTEVIGGL